MKDIAAPAVKKMREAGAGDLATRVFRHHLETVARGDAGFIRETEIRPLENLPRFGGGNAGDAIARTAVIKLNGGLGTSMGLAQAKSLLHVTPEKTFFDIIVAQVMTVRRSFGATLPAVFMNSFHTERDTAHYLDRFEDLAVPRIPLSFLQNRVPKVLRDDLTPVSYPANPDLEWCPPGHGDLFTALPESGVLGALLEQGYRYAMVSNSDNLGAFPDPGLAQWFADSGAPFAMEVCRRQSNDRKGGHLAVRASDGTIILREVAQTAPEDLADFQNIERHSYFNTNTLWLDLGALSDELDRRGGFLGLPVIRNAKTVDPADPTSAEVYQLETGMGSGIEIFEGALAIEVDRSRFLPVKTTNDLFLLRSDAFDVDETGVIEQTVGTLPRIDLDPSYFGHMRGFEARCHHIPSLRAARSLTVVGDYTFREGLVVEGDLTLG